MKLQWAGLILCAVFAWVSDAQAEIRRALLSVDQLRIGPNEQIRSFHIKTWGVEILAICHVPPSWQLKAEKYEDPEGDLYGSMDTHGEPLKSLPKMYLVDVYDYQRLPIGNDHPASFAGWVEVGTVASFGGGSARRRTLKAGNFRLINARSCPEPAPPQP